MSFDESQYMEEAPNTTNWQIFIASIKLGKILSAIPFIFILSEDNNIHLMEWIVIYICEAVRPVYGQGP